MADVARLLAIHLLAAVSCTGRLVAPSLSHRPGAAKEIGLESAPVLGV